MARTLTDNTAFIQRQQQTPLADALIRHKQRRVVPFDVPGHKRGKGMPALREYLGDMCVSIDVNAMKPLDNLCHPVSVIKQAETLAAEAFGCSRAFFSVGGTTSSVQTMILSCCGEGDTIILPRNVHRSALGALILTGAVPVYVDPGLDEHLGIPLGMALRDVQAAIAAHPDAKAVFFNNPTYYGVCPDISGIINAAHSHGMLALADEAHGTHLYFGSSLPPGAMQLGADMAAVSMHKTGGSLTQSAMLLINEERISADHVRVVMNLSQTTSASYLLMASLDIARKALATDGQAMFAHVLALADDARREINSLGGYLAFADNVTAHAAAYAFDRTKLSIHTLGIGLSGFEVYDMLRDDYGIQVEFGDAANILAIISPGDTQLTIERLVASLAEIKRLHAGPAAGMFDHEYIAPDVRMSPKSAFYADKKALPLSGSAGAVSGEFVMCYPPGIPIVAPGEMITREIVDYIRYARQKGASLTGAADMSFETIQVISKAR